VLHGQDRLYAYVLNPDQTVSVRTVQIKSDNGTLAIITSGLDEGQQVVTDGQSRLLEGAKVAVLPAASKQAGG
jgi:membrane fusion protein, multidrug efflux system